MHPCSFGNFFQNYMLRCWRITNPFHLSTTPSSGTSSDLPLMHQLSISLNDQGSRTAHPSHYINCCVPLCIRFRRLLHGWIAQLCWPVLAVWGVVCSSSTYSQSKPLRIGNTAPPWPRSMGYHLHSRQHAHRCHALVLGRCKYWQALQPDLLSHICPYISIFLKTDKWISVLHFLPLTCTFKVLLHLNYGGRWIGWSLIVRNISGRWPPLCSAKWDSSGTQLSLSKGT